MNNKNRKKHHHCDYAPLNTKNDVYSEISQNGIYIYSKMMIIKNFLSQIVIRKFIKLNQKIKQDFKQMVVMQQFLLRIISR